MWLIAEDEMDIRNLVETLCQAWGYKPMSFENGTSVWNWLDDVEAGRYHGPLPDFALMDIRMPGKRGDELAYRMRSIPAIQNIPVVLMTAFSLNANQRDDMLKYGVDEIINKPLPDFDVLYAKLHDVMYTKQQ
jgi:CheY-like chemotaxis protein